MTAEVPGSLHWQFGPWKPNSAFTYPANYNLPSDCTRWLNLAKLDPSKLHNVNTTSSVLQATTARGAYGRVVASYQQYEYNDNLNEGLSIINNMTKTT